MGSGTGKPTRSGMFMDARSRPPTGKPGCAVVHIRVVRLVRLPPGTSAVSCGVVGQPETTVRITLKKINTLHAFRRKKSLFNPLTLPDPVSCSFVGFRIPVVCQESPDWE